MDGIRVVRDDHGQLAHVMFGEGPPLVVVQDMFRPVYAIDEDPLVARLLGDLALFAGTAYVPLGTLTLGSQVGSQRPHTSMDAYGRLWTVSPGEPVIYGRVWTPVDVRRPHDAQGVGGSIPSRPTRNA